MTAGRCTLFRLWISSRRRACPSGLIGCDSMVEWFSTGPAGLTMSARMSIVGGNPESGVRIEIERAASGGPPWVYQGEAVTSNERYPVRAVVEADGAVTFTSEGGAPPELLE